MLLGQPLVVEVTVGWTRSDMENGYSSFDGYRVGASQHTETFEVEVAVGQPLHALEYLIAEAAFAATNFPPGTTEDSLAEQILAKITASGYRGQGAHYSLSVGDTVTVGEVMLACERTGWTRVSHLDETSVA